jgi:chemotaxis protein MotB
MADSVHPPIIIKKVGRHGVQHGGAWKVAYADFVTAMMALFIVLWLMASNEQVKKSIAAYFLDPQGKSKQMGSALMGSGESMMLSKQDLAELEKKIQQALRKIPEMDKDLKNQVTMTITGEGLRIELLENSKGVFFEPGNARPTEIAEQIIGVLGEELGKLPNHVFVEGHTDANPYHGSTGYSNWELSADRANEARRLMQEHGVRADQVKQVRGYADQNLRDKQHPTDASNRRISVIVAYTMDQLPADLQGKLIKDVPGEVEHKAEGKEAAKPSGSGHH